MCAELLKKKKKVNEVEETLNTCKAKFHFLEIIMLNETHVSLQWLTTYFS